MRWRIRKRWWWWWWWWYIAVVVVVDEVCENAGIQWRGYIYIKGDSLTCWKLDPTDIGLPLAMLYGVNALAFIYVYSILYDDNVFVHT